MTLTDTKELVLVVATPGVISSPFKTIAQQKQIQGIHASKTGTKHGFIFR